MPQEQDWTTKLATVLRQKRGKEPLPKVAQKLQIGEDVLEELEKGNLGSLSLGEFREILRQGYGIQDPSSVPEGSVKLRKGWVLIRDEGTPYREWDGRSIKWRHWLSRLESAKMVPELLVLPPRRLKGDIGRTREGQHAGEELLYTLSGKVKVHLWEEDRGEYGAPFELTKGNILHFHSHIKHFVENGSTSYETVILVVRVGPERE